MNCAELRSEDKFSHGSEKGPYEVAGSDLSFGGSRKLAVDPTLWVAVCRPVDGSSRTYQVGSRSTEEDAAADTYGTMQWSADSRSMPDAADRIGAMPL